MQKKSILKALGLGALALVAAGTLAACGSKSGASSHTYTVGVASASQKDIFENLVAPAVKKEGITLKVKQFSDYTQENPATQDGSLDLNSFQHIAFLNNWNKENKGSLVEVGYTLISPFGLYSDKIKDYKNLKDGDTVGVPNDPTNEGRALQLLDAIGVIRLKTNAPDSPQLTDIASYNKKITIKPIQADQLAAALPDLAAATINTNYVTDQLHTTPEKSAIYIDTDHLSKVSTIYKNVIVVSSKNKDNADLKKIITAYQTDEVAKAIEKTGDLPAWDGAKK
ncbi:MAG: MetQ/NlpA family ABC transporter substrate-binding protein [Streptococcaceae bacterium]|nr:MetQ/NlpA family ABC transporter substrate-binding protein [Streptococcaceae bacterium]